MKKNCSFHLLLFLFLSPLAAGAREITIKVSNPISEARHGEIVELQLPEQIIESEWTLTDSGGNEQTFQITHDGKLLFAADLAPEETAVYTLKTGRHADPDTVCYGRIFPERLDDLAWENDRAAYRAYGPALQASGEKAYGYDIWTKSVEFPVLEKRYHGALKEGISFHKDHGEGMDVYAVGPTLGGGTTALLDEEGRIIMPWCWTEAEVLDNGPLRFTAKLKYAPTVYGKDTIAEIRTISIDKGEWLNSTDVAYHGAPTGSAFVAGVVVHDSNPKCYRLLQDNNTVLYTDYTQEPFADNGYIFVGMTTEEDSELLFQPMEGVAGVSGHVLIKMKSGEKPTRYYWGGAWSKGGIESIEAWQEYLMKFRQRKANPIKAEIVE